MSFTIQKLNCKTSCKTSFFFIVNGYKVKIDLYIATMDDMVRFLLQQQFYHMFLSNSKVGIKSTDVNLLLHVASYSPNLW